jgi:hypothetical protein
MAAGGALFKRYGGRSPITATQSLIADIAIAVDASAFVESAFRAQKGRAFQASSPNDFGLVRSDRPFFCPQRIAT